MKIKQALINKIGCVVAKWIIHNCDDGLVVNRKGGAEQVIKVYSVQAYKNFIKPAVKNAANISDLSKFITEVIFEEKETILEAFENEDRQMLEDAIFYDLESCAEDAGAGEK